MQNKSAFNFKPNLLKNALRLRRVMDREVLSGVRSRGIAKAPPHGEHPFDVRWVLLNGHPPARSRQKRGGKVKKSHSNVDSILGLSSFVLSVLPLFSVVRSS